MPDVDFTLYLITDRHRVPGGDLPSAVARALEGGVRAVQLREKDLPEAEFLPLARELRLLTRRFGARLLINGRLELALAVGADGVHLPGGSDPVETVRRRLGPGPLIGVSTHHPTEVAAARLAGADFATFGPVYFTPSKAACGLPVGLENLRHACDCGLPVFPLGGVTAERIPELLAAGAAGIACIGAVLSAPDPAASATEILNRLNS